MPEREAPSTPAQGATSPVGVTFLQDPPQRDRTMVVLLAVITGLLAILVVGLAAGAIWVAGEYNRMAATGRALQVQLAETQAATVALLDQTNQRQADMTNRLTQEHGALSSEFAELENQRRALGATIPDDPFSKADYAIRVSQLTLAHLSLNNRYWTSMHQTITRTVTPLPAMTELSDAVTPNAPEQPR